MKLTPSSRMNRREEFSLPLLLGFFLWLVLLAGGSIGLIRYAGTPAVASQDVLDWPRKSTIIPDPHLPTLILFLHPFCPCSRATLTELERLLARIPGKSVSTIFFVRPPGAPEGWEKTDLWKTARLIPETTVRIDSDGREAKLFHAETSGLTLLYDRNGHLVFKGGITIARGHEGESPGQDALRVLSMQALPELVHTPVFGCSLLGGK